MTYLIVMALLLTFIQVGLLPLAFNLRNVDYLLGNRDESNPESLLVGRAKRAGSNLLESLPSFIALAILSVVLAVDNSDLAVGIIVVVADVDDRVVESFGHRRCNSAFPASSLACALALEQT